MSNRNFNPKNSRRKTPYVLMGVGSGVQPRAKACPAEEWREVKPWDEAQAFVARKALADLRMYPGEAMDEGEYPALNSDFRGRLHQMVNELPLTEICGLYQLARILLITPRPAQIIAYVEDQARADIDRVFEARVNP